MVKLSTVLLGAADAIIGSLAWFGLLAVLAIGTVIWFSPTWCVGDGCSVQGWISASSGWAAAAVALPTIVILMRQTRAAWRAVEVAGEATDEARRSSERQLRGYVFVESVTFDNQKIELQIKYKNFGATPAEKVNVDSQIWFESRPGNIIARINSPSAPLGPSQHSIRYFRIGEDIFKSWEPDLLERREILFVGGRIDFTDAFGKRRFTNFRRMLVPDHGKFREFLNIPLEGNEFE
jgi:hypothetical protein